MTRTATRYLYVARHAEALPDESGLTENGRRQAVLLGQRLRDIPFTSIHHGPLPRAAQTARLVKDQLANDVVLQMSEAAGDYVPYVPEKAELPPDSADHLLQFLHQATPDELKQGPELARVAEEHFTGPVDGEDQHQLVITHAFLVAWLVRHAIDAPNWRWLTLTPTNAALTILRYPPTGPSSILLYNNLSEARTDGS
jgi:probable phosphoglycerate mutase